jgi:hypothetical protein
MQLWQMQLLPAALRQMPTLQAAADGVAAGCIRLLLVMLPVLVC